jgi:DAACS family dicarboxylate/amino acid:cation (Na+ or H+) symporter
VFALIFTTTARFGYELLSRLGLYVFTVLAGLTLHALVTYPVLLRVMGGYEPVQFFRKVRTVILTAFSTSSSNATLPTTMRTAEAEIGVPPQIAGFVLPLGATVNMNGTALFEGVTVLFIAQVLGADLGLGQQLIVILMSVVTAIGVAGVPGGSIPLLMLVLGAVQLPPEGIAIVLGVDRLLDMCRTTVNVTGDLVVSVLVTRAERYRLVPAPAARREV